MPYAEGDDRRSAAAMSLWQSFLPALFGWPGVLASLSLASAGLLLKSPRVLASGALLAVPFGIYVASFPGLYGLPLALLALYGTAPFLVRRNRPRAALLAIPFFTMAGTVAAMVALENWPR
jgi:hypothetical protein